MRFIDGILVQNIDRFPDNMPDTGSKHSDQKKNVRSIKDILFDMFHDAAIYSDKAANKAVVVGLAGLFVVHAAAKDNEKYGLSMTTYAKRQAACLYFTKSPCDEKTLSLVDFKAWKDRILGRSPL
jgi:hypothetical protein